MAFKVVIFILCIVFITKISSRTLPSYVKPCKRDDPNINECVKKILENIRPYINKGISEMHILPLDPMTVPSLTLNQGSGSVNFNALFTELKGYGAKNYQIEKLKINLKNNTMETDITLPTFKIESRYEINGKVLLLPIKGNGKFDGNFSNTQVNVKFTLKKNVGKNKKTYLEIKESKINLKFESVKLNFDNLFNGNKELGDQTNRFINDNWKDLMQEIRPLIEDTVATIVLGIFKPVFEVYSMDDLFPV